MTGPDGVSHRDWHQLTRWPFLAALALLVANDWIFKQAFHNALTGKLSDFAGLFAFGVFACLLVRVRPRFVLAGVAVAFAFWKSTASQPLIDGWNSLGLWTVGRAVDGTDLAALPVLLLVPFALRRGAHARRRRVLEAAVTAASLIAFTATGPASIVEPRSDAHYVDAPLERIESLVFLIGADRTSPSEAYGWRIWLRTGDEVSCGYGTAGFDVLGDARRSVIRLAEISHHCMDRDRVRPLVPALLQAFEDEVVAQVKRLLRDSTVVAWAAAHADSAAGKQAMPHPPLLPGQLELVAPEAVERGAGGTLRLRNESRAAVQYSACYGIRERVDDGGLVLERAPLRAPGEPCSGYRVLPDGASIHFTVDDRWTEGLWRIRLPLLVNDAQVDVVSDVFRVGSP